MEKEDKQNDLMYELSTNMKYTRGCSTEQQFNKRILKAIRLGILSEKSIRSSTITFVQSKDFYTNEKIIELIKTNWADESTADKTISDSWANKEYSFVRFDTLKAREAFISYISAETKKDNDCVVAKLARQILEPNKQGCFITRKKFRLIIERVPAHLNILKLNKIIKNYKGNKDFRNVSEAREGKSYGQTGGKQFKTLSFLANAKGIQTIFEDKSGVIRYEDKDKHLPLFFKISLKPWSCKDCNFIGLNHKCNGKLCGKCCEPGHLTKDCKSKFIKCINCKSSLHKSKDSNCPIYFRSIVRELFNSDIPSDYLDNLKLMNHILDNMVIV